MAIRPPAGDGVVAALNHSLELFRPNWDYQDTEDPPELNCDGKAWKEVGDSKAASGVRLWASSASASNAKRCEGLACQPRAKFC